MTDRKRAEVGRVYRSETDDDKKYQRNKQRLLKSAARHGSAAIQKATEKIARADSAVTSQDEGAIRLTQGAMMSAMSVWDSPYIERAEKEKSDSVRGSNVRTASYNERDEHIFSVYESIRQCHPGKNKSWYLDRLRKELIKEVNAIINDDDIVSEQSARKMYGSPDYDRTDPNEERKQFLSISRLGNIVRKKKYLSS